MKRQCSTLSLQRLSQIKPGRSTITLSKGFTIVELLVVIVVIGILAAITIVSYTGISSRATAASLTSDLDNASKQLKIFQVSDASGNYPTANKCPTEDNTQICLKSSAGNEFTYYPFGVDTNPDGFGLKATNGATNHTITNNSSPKVMSTLAVSDPTNWLVIGTQVWAKANLNVGTRVNSTTTQTSGNGIEKYCYNNTDAGCTNTDSNGIAYGGLYQWDEAMQYVNTEGAQGICPAGSHIPSDNDWSILERYLGTTQVQADTFYEWRGIDQGTQLKSGGSSGLNIPFAGYRSSVDGSFVDLSSGGDLWSSSEPNFSAWGRDLSLGNASVFRGTYDEGNGFSVRCIGN